MISSTAESLFRIAAVPALRTKVIAKSREADPLARGKRLAATRSSTPSRSAATVTNMIEEMVRSGRHITCTASSRSATAIAPSASNMTTIAIGAY
jgi:hypothetical protein